MNFSSDLCTLSTLTESTLLCSLEQRCKDKLVESYVGGVLLSLGSSKITEPQFLPSFASSVLRSLAFSCEDQSVLISGYNKTKLSYDLLSAMLNLLEQQPSGLGSSILLVNELLDYLIHTAGDGCGRAVVATTLVVSPASLVLTAASVSCLLLDTSHVSYYKVLHERTGIKHVETCLKELGMEPGLAEQAILVLGIINGLLTGADMAHILGDVQITNLHGHLPSEHSLAQILYAYFVQWIVHWVNSNCLGNDNRSGSCCISVICAPGHSISDHSTMESTTLSALIPRYANEVLHNIYCTRLFVWEQEQYLEEGITWYEVEVEFNQKLINTFHQEGGLLEVFEMSSEEEIKCGVARCCQCSGDSCFMVGRDRGRFALAHFTGECEYVIDEKWMEADRVHMASSQLQTLLLSSSCSVLVDIAQNLRYSADVLPNGDRMDCSRLTQRAKVAMDSICELITTSQPHFVFCFKPFKDERKAFNCEFVLSQLQQFKILDIALIQSCGYPVRLKHSNFLKVYGALFVEDGSQVLSNVEKCFHILDVANLKEWHVGKTMVMLKPWHLSQLDAAVDLFNQSAKKLQRVFRQSISRKKNPTLAPNNAGTNPPLPPPRPSYTLPAVSGDYDRASSPSHSPRVSPKKLSWKIASSSNVCRRGVSTVSNLLAHVWFQGKLSREKAEGRLNEVQFGCFLVRESESRVGEYALSLRHDGVVKHFRIDTKHGLSPRYELYGAKRSFPSLEVLIDYYSHHCISSGGELLTTPFSTEKQINPPSLTRDLSSIRRPKPSLTAVPVNERRLPRTCTTPILNENSDSHVPIKGLSLDLSDDSLAKLRRELEVEERIIEAARRIAELPCKDRRERQKRKQSLLQAQSRLLSLRQQFHTLQERKRFIETSMLNNSQS